MKQGRFLPPLFSGSFSRLVLSSSLLLSLWSMRYISFNSRVEGIRPVLPPGNKVLRLDFDPSILGSWALLSLPLDLKGGKNNPGIKKKT